jgi:hypothetical protein
MDGLQWAADESENDVVFIHRIESGMHVLFSRNADRRLPCDRVGVLHVSLRQVSVKMHIDYRGI